MKCHKCGGVPMGVCAFCGRAVCETCYAPHVNLLTIFVGDKQTPKAIAVSNALWCGTCKPHPEPIEMPELW